MTSPYLLSKPRSLDDVILLRERDAEWYANACERQLKRQHARQDQIQERWNETRERDDG